MPDDMLPESTLDINDIERRRIGFLSLRLKIEAARRLLDQADQKIDELTRLRDSSGELAIYSGQQSAYLKLEAAFASMDEAMKNLEPAQVLCSKLGSQSSIPRLPRYKSAVEAGGSLI